MFLGKSALVLNRFKTLAKHEASTRFHTLLLGSRISCNDGRRFLVFCQKSVIVLETPFSGMGVLWLMLIINHYRSISGQVSDTWHIKHWVPFQCYCRSKVLMTNERPHAISYQLLYTMWSIWSIFWDIACPKLTDLRLFFRGHQKSKVLMPNERPHMTCHQWLLTIIRILVRFRRYIANQKFNDLWLSFQGHSSYKGCMKSY